MKTHKQANLIPNEKEVLKIPIHLFVRSPSKEKRHQ